MAALAPIPNIPNEYGTKIAVGPTIYTITDLPWKVFTSVEIRRHFGQEIIQTSHEKNGCVNDSSFRIEVTPGHEAEVLQYIKEKLTESK